MIKELRDGAIDPYFFVDEDTWSYVCETYDKDAIKEELADILMEYPLPYMEISKQDALDDYRSLKGIKWNDLFVKKPWFPRNEYELPVSDSIIRRSNVGNKSSNFFQQANRWEPDAWAYPGPKRTWATRKLMVTLMGSLFSLKATHVDKSILRTAIALRKYICSQFKPSVAKVIYDKYGADVVLDFSAGWGDRLAGFYASETATKYIGIDPRAENHPIYNEQVEFYEKHRTFFETEKSCEFICSPAEDADLSKYENQVDLVMTSPPYFNIERYSKDDTQSWVRYRKIDDWNRLFLHAALKNVWKTLKSGGLLMVNISDVYSVSIGGGGKKFQKICNPMNEYLSSLGDSEYVGCIGMEMAKRPSCLGIGTSDDDKTRFSDEYLSRDGVFGEPIWVWRKR